MRPICHRNRSVNTRTMHGPAASTARCFLARANASASVQQAAGKQISLFQATRELTIRVQLDDGWNWELALNKTTLACAASLP